MQEILKTIMTFKHITGNTRKSLNNYTVKDLHTGIALYTYKEALEQIFSLVEKTLNGDL